MSTWDWMFAHRSVVDWELMSELAAWASQSGEVLGSE